MIQAIRVDGLLRTGMLPLLALLLPVATLNAGARSRTTYHALAEEILETAGVKGGLIVHLGCGDGRLTAALRPTESFIVQGLDTRAENVARAREHILKLGSYGPVSVDSFDGRRLPYTDNLVNLLVAEDIGGVSMDEVMRVLAPLGTALLKRGDKWVSTVKPWPDEIDEWTHFLHDASGNAVARDSVVGPPRRMQWVANPLYARSHEIQSSLSALVSSRGRVFYIYDEGLIGITDQRLPPKWSLIARDAFNGVLLWKRPIPHWGWRQWSREAMEGKDWTTLRGLRGRVPSTVARRLVAQGDKLYTTLAYAAPLAILDAATGEVLVTCRGTEGTDEILCSDGIVVVCIRQSLNRRLQRRTAQPVPDTIAALKAETGEILWRAQPGGIQPMSMTIQGECVVLSTGKDIVCLDLKDGTESWRTPRKGGGTFVSLEDVVLVRSGDRYEAFSMADGQRLWQKTWTGGKGSIRSDLFVVSGLVWHGSPAPGRIVEPEKFWDQPFNRPRDPQTGVNMVGIDPKTGEVRKTIEIANLLTPGHHFRCYRSKATQRYILWPKRAIEFIDLGGSDHMRNDWVRGPCGYGVMPCNGLLYVPPNQCFCYTGVNLRGFNALASKADRQENRRTAEGEHRLETGPAFGDLGPRPSSEAVDPARNWLTLRHDAGRTGSTATEVSADLCPLWRTGLGGRLTQPVVAGGMLYVSAVDEHSLYALDAATGDVRWRYTAGGRVDSPPTLHDGLVLFGSADGRVTCLRASDGQLAWRFRAAPQDVRVVAFGQVESAWPVHGSVLVKDGLVYTSAGRSSYLDGGIYLYALNPRTGEQVHRGRIEGPHPDLRRDIGQPFSMEGTFSDVLVTDGTDLYMQQVVLDSSLKQQQPPRLTNMGDKRFGRHVFSTAGFLDGSWWNRTFWMHSERYPGFYIAQQAPKAGQLLVCNDTTTYAVKCYTKRNVHSPMFFPGTDGYLFFADDNQTEPALTGDPGDPKPLRWLPHQHARKELQLDYRAVDFDKGVGFTRSKPAKWAHWVPLRIRAMVLAGDTLFVAGPPDVLPAEDPLAAFEGRRGGQLWVVSAEDGNKVAQVDLDSPPVFDGLIAAHGRLFMSTLDGRVLCMGPKEEPQKQ